MEMSIIHSTHIIYKNTNNIRQEESRETSMNV